LGSSERENVGAVWKSYSPEFRKEAVKLVIETSRPIAQVAKELGVHEATLGNRVNTIGVSMPAKSRPCR
jgi:transposase-like protein